MVDGKQEISNNSGVVNFKSNQGEINGISINTK